VGNSIEIYNTRWFNRWARKQGLSTSSLCSAVREMASGLYEADLGGGLLKKRIARPGQGKSGSNIDKDEEEALKRLATHLLSLMPQDLEKAKLADELVEVRCDAEDKISDT
jgi:hypothetical protein